jgi:hypothetical protein
MSRYTGPQSRGAQARNRARKRVEADTRNARTLPHKRAAYWRDLTELADELEPGPCLWPWKTAYPTEAVALAALHGIGRLKKRQGLHPYPCRAGGHWHLGRLLRRSSAAWKRAAA